MTTATGDFVFDFKLEADADPFTDPAITFFLDDAQIESGLLNSKWVVSPRLLLVDNGHSYGTSVTSRIEKNSPSTAGGECGPGLYDSMGNGYELKAYYEELRLFRVTLAATRVALGSQINSAHAAGSVFGLSIDADGNLIGYLNGVDIGFGAVTDTTFPSSTLKAGAYSDRESSGGGFASGVFSFAGAGVLAANSLDELDSPLSVGGSEYEGETTGMGAIVSITYGTITGNAGSIFTFDMDEFSHGDFHPGMGVQTFTVVDADDLEASKTSTIQPMDGYSYQTMGASIDRGEYSIGKDPAIVTDDQVHLPTGAGTLNANGTLTGFTPGTYLMWRRDQSDGIMYSSYLTVSDSGAIDISSVLAIKKLGIESMSIVSLTIKKLT